MESAIYTGTLRHRRFEPARHEFTYPLLTAKIITAIHWEALKLYLKKVPVYAHPARRRENNYEHVSGITR